MSLRILKTVALGIASSFFAAVPANACRSIQSEGFVYLPTMPKEVPDGALVLRVEKDGEIDQLAKVVELRVIEVLKGSFEGPKARIQLPAFNSCSRRSFHLPQMIVVGFRSANLPRIEAIEFRLGQLKDVEILDGGSFRIKRND